MLKVEFEAPTIRDICEEKLLSSKRTCVVSPTWIVIEVDLFNDTEASEDVVVDGDEFALLQVELRQR